MTREELIKIRDAETWREVQEEIDALLAEHESEIISEGWESVEDFIANGNFEIFVENTIEADLKKMHMDGDTENATKEELFGEPLGYNPVNELEKIFGEALGRR